MYDPESDRDDKPKKLQVNGRPAANRKLPIDEPLPPKPRAEILSPKEKLKTYIIESAMVRDAMGLLLKKGKLIMVDKAKIDKLDGPTRDLLREIYKEMQ